jgi:hypothetical protein
MLKFFLLVHFTPCNVGLYSSAGGKNELGEKNSTLQGASHQKKFTGRKNKIRLHCRGKDPFTLIIIIVPLHV